MNEIADKFIFEFGGYKPYLKARLGAKGTRKGGRSLLAKHLGCQTTFVSQVLNGSANFSLEQAHAINRFFNHDEDESDGFLFLVLRERAGSKDLENYFATKFDALLHKRREIKNRLKKTESLSREVQSQYYSHWYYIAVHMLLSIPGYRQRESIAEYLKMPVQRVTKIIEFLESNGLIELRDGSYVIGPRHIHLAESSDNIFKHHSNWRLEAIHSLHNIGERNDLHYSVVYSLSRKDVERLREIIISAVKSNLEIVKDSPEEVLYCNTIDFFEVRK